MPSGTLFQKRLQVEFIDLRRRQDLLRIVPENIVLQENPEVIIGTAEKSSPEGGVNMWKRYSTLTAVQRGNLFLLDGNLLNRAGPRMIAGTVALCEKLEQARHNRNPNQKAQP